MSAFLYQSCQDLSNKLSWISLKVLIYVTVYLGLTLFACIVLGIPCPIVAHAGDGNFHVVVMFDPTSSSELAEVKRFSKNMALQAISRGGTCTGEHGIGSGD